jgi:hypothetical protein
MNKPVKLTKEEATKAVKEIVQYGKVEFSGHCKRDSMPKRDVKPTDIIKVLWDGRSKGKQNGMKLTKTGSIE